jgi:hypothetical protein
MFDIFLTKLLQRNNLIGDKSIRRNGLVCMAMLGELQGILKTHGKGPGFFFLSPSGF